MSDTDELVSEKITDAADARKFILGGNATFTLQSDRTGNRYTFKVSQPDDNSPHFVKVLTGPQNTSDYTYLGTIFKGQDYVHGKKSRVTEDAPSAIAFDWAWRALKGNKMPAQLSMFHMGRCAACNRPLTDPESIRTGFGPICRSR